MTSNSGNSNPVSIVLLTTCDGQLQRLQDVHRLVASVEHGLASVPDAVVRHFLLVQRFNEQQGRDLSADFPDFVTVFTSEKRVSLSRARNLLLSDEIAGTALATADIVAFPDDDCWYPDGTLAAVIAAFRDPQLDFWFCRYGSHAVAPTRKAEVPPLQSVISYASSNTIFLRGSLAQKTQGFDERLGIGSEINGGEDTEYALKAFHGARKSLFVSERAVGHRDFDGSHRSRYFSGAMVAIWRHAGKSPAGIWAAMRKTLVGVALAATGRMAVGDLVHALRLSVRHRR